VVVVEATVVVVVEATVIEAPAVVVVEAPAVVVVEAPAVVVAEAPAAVVQAASAVDVRAPVFIRVTSAVYCVSVYAYCIQADSTSVDVRAVHHHKRVVEAPAAIVEVRVVTIASVALLLFLGGCAYATSLGQETSVRACLVRMSDLLGIDTIVLPILILLGSRLAECLFCLP